MLTRPLLHWHALGVATLLTCAVPTAAASPAERAAAQREVAALVGDAACRQDSDCMTLALPDQACGGPQGWLAYSTRRTDPVALQRALQREHAFASRAGGAAVSTCGIVADPGSMCVPASGTSPAQPRSCVLRPRGAGAPLR